MPLSIEEINKLKAVPQEGLLPVIATRWSPRSFSDKDVSANDLRLILEAARWTPSSSNQQPWRFLVGVKGSETHQKIFNTLVPFNQSWASKAPVLILGTAVAKDSKGTPNAYALYDLGQAVASLVLQAEALGLVAHSMGGFDHAGARAAFSLGDDLVIGAVTAIGYQGQPSALENETLREREIAPRERKPLSEIALTALGEPLQL